MMSAPESAFPPGVVGLTGGIASGKSSVCRWLMEHGGLAGLSADELVAELLEVGGEGWRQLRTWLDSGFFSSNGRLDKPMLRREIFSDTRLRHRVESCLHPLVLTAISERVAARPAFNQRPMLIEVPLLFEAGWQVLFNKVVLVSAADDVCLSRLRARDGVTEEEAHLALKAQMPLERKRQWADYVIDNSTKWPETVVQLEKLQKELDTIVAMS
ncbi:Dephospho-CoA kinase [hydrothermal vent metagenome]|uniref:Dephospho-CoA kinase n=2 Tax=hydrothermal vent metagenome TaxID=652676 RepID=A0A3B0VH49_9ZZZZ